MSGTKVVRLSPEDGAATKVKALNNLLPVLLHRAGGSVEVTPEEFAQVKALYAGGMAIALEELPGGGFRLSLVAKRRSQGDAVM